VPFGCHRAARVFARCAGVQGRGGRDAWTPPCSAACGGPLERRRRAPPTLIEAPLGTTACAFVDGTCGTVDGWHPSTLVGGSHATRRWSFFFFQSTAVRGGGDGDAEPAPWRRGGAYPRGGERAPRSFRTTPRARGLLRGRQRGCASVCPPRRGDDPPRWGRPSPTGAPCLRRPCHEPSVVCQLHGQGDGAEHHERVEWSGRHTDVGGDGRRQRRPERCHPRRRWGRGWGGAPPLGRPDRRGWRRWRSDGRDARGGGAPPPPPQPAEPPKGLSTRGGGRGRSPSRASALGTCPSTTRPCPSPPSPFSLIFPFRRPRPAERPQRAPHRAARGRP